MSKLQLVNVIILRAWQLHEALSHKHAVKAAKAQRALAALVQRLEQDEELS